MTAANSLLAAAQNGRTAPDIDRAAAVKAGILTGQVQDQ